MKKQIRKYNLKKTPPAGSRGAEKKSREAIACRDSLTGEEKAAVRALIEACNANDHTAYGMAEDADLYYLFYQREGGQEKQLAAALFFYRMGKTKAGQAVDEVMAFTHPAFRKKGYFSKLFSKAKERARGVLECAVYRNGLSEAVLSTLSAKYLYDECIMERSLSEGEALRIEEKSDGALHEKRNQAFYVKGKQTFQENGHQGLLENGHQEFLEKLEEAMQVCRMEEDLFFWRYGECRINRYGKEAYLYAVLTYRQYQRQGYGKAMLLALFARLRAEGMERIFLEVSSENEAALCLYHSIGFQLREALSFYRL